MTRPSADTPAARPADQPADLAVIGAGPAGARAALAAAETGLAVVLIDEARAAGGQLHRAPAQGRSAAADADGRRGEALRAAVAAAPLRRRSAQSVWSVAAIAEGGPFGIHLVGGGPDGAGQSLCARRVIAATGALERVVPFAGWTAPGVIGLAAATALLKTEGALPARRVVVAGRGPLLAAVAAKAIAAGSTVVAIVDGASAGDWAAAAPALARRPELFGRGVSWWLTALGRRTPVYFRSAVRAAEGDDRLTMVRIGPVRRDGAPADGPETRLAADLLAVGDGLTPGGDIPKLLGAAHRFDRALGGWVPVCDAVGRTSVAGLYAAGDGAGVRGGAWAWEAGRLAGLAAALDLGGLSAAAFETAAAPPRRRLARLRPFADAVSAQIAPRAAAVAAIPAETVVCRCEDVTRTEIDAAIDRGAGDLQQVKHLTRAGMGPCQGRLCGETVAEMLGLRLARGGVDGRPAAGYWTPRPPLRPAPLSALIGEFSYDDIPIPAPAPL